MAKKTYYQVKSVTVTCEGTWDISAGNDSWIKLGNGSNYADASSNAWETARSYLTGITGNATIYVRVSPNENPATRNATLTATVTSNSEGVTEQSATCTITQEG